MRRLTFTLVLLASAAQANVVTQTAVLGKWGDPTAQWGSSIDLHFLKFDSALGELTGVQFQVTADIGMYFADWPAGSPDYLLMQDSLFFTPMGSAYRVFTYSNPFGLPAGAVDTSLRVAKSGSMSHDLSSFVGLDWWSMTVGGNVWVYAQGPSSAVLPAGALSLRNLSVQMDYQYTPAIAAAEPRYAGMLLIGIALAAFLVRRSLLLRRRAGDSFELN